MNSITKNNVLSHDDNRGDLVYPFLVGLQWRIESHHISSELPDGWPTLRWVKDNKVMDLFVPGMDTAAFLAHSGLQLHMDKGPMLLSKRLGRLMRPYRYFKFFGVNDLSINFNESLDGR